MTNLTRAKVKRLKIQEFHHNVRNSLKVGAKPLLSKKQRFRTLKYGNNK